MAVSLLIVLVNDFLIDFQTTHANQNNLMNVFVDDICIAEAVEYDKDPQMN